MLHNWKDAKEYYIGSGWLSGVSMMDVSKVFNIPYQSVRRRAATEQWRLERERVTVDDPECKTIDDYIYWYK